MPLYSKLASHLDPLAGAPRRQSQLEARHVSVPVERSRSAPEEPAPPRARFVQAGQTARLRPLLRRRSKSTSAALPLPPASHGPSPRRYSTSAVRVSDVWAPGTPAPRVPAQPPGMSCRARAVIVQLADAVAHGDEAQVLVALDSLRALPPGERENTSVYNEALEALRPVWLSAAQTKRIMELFRGMLACGPHPDATTYALVAELLCTGATARRKKHHHARAADVAAADTLFAEALQIAATAHAEHCAFHTTGTYNALLEYCAQSGNTRGAVEVLALLEQNILCKADPDSYRHLIDAFVADRSMRPHETAGEQQQRRSNACEQLFEAFELSAAAAASFREFAERWGAPKKAAVWAAMLRARVELGDAADAVALFERMMSQGRADAPTPPVDEAAVSALVHGFVFTGDCDAAVQWLGQVCTAELPRPSRAAIDELLDAIAHLPPDACLAAHTRLAEMLAPWIAGARGDVSVCGYCAAAAATQIERHMAAPGAPAAAAALDALDARFFRAPHAATDSIVAAAAATVRLVTRFTIAGHAAEAARFFAHVVSALRRLDSGAPAVVRLVRDACHLPMSIADAAAQPPSKAAHFAALATLVAPALQGYAGPLADVLNAALVRQYAAASRELHGELPALQLGTDAWQHVLNGFCGEERASHRADLGLMRRVGIGRLLGDLAPLHVPLDLGETRALLTDKYGDEGAAALDSWISGTERPAAAAPHDLPHDMSGTCAAHLPPVHSIAGQLGTLVGSVVRPGAEISHEEAYDVLMEHVQRGVYPPPGSLAALISAFGRDSDVARIDELHALALHVLAAQKQSAEAHVRGWAQVEEAMIIALSHAGAAARANAHRERLVAAGQAPSASAYAALIATIQERTDDAAIAEELFGESQRLGVRPTTYLFNTVISKLSRARKAEQALQLFDAMRSARVRPTSVTFGAAINACVRTGDEARATALFAEMESQKSFQPRVPPYNTMIQYYVYSRPQRERALHYYEKMQAAGVRPSAHTYKLLLDMWGTIEPVQPDRQQTVFAKLSADRLVSVQGTHWASLIHTHGTVLRNLDRAIEIFESIADQAPMSRAGVSTVPNAVVYESLLAVFVAHGRTDLMPAYTTRMLGQDILPTAYIANLLIKGYAADGPLGLAEARRVFNSMSDPPAGVAAAGNHLPRHHGAGALRSFREQHTQRSSGLAADSANMLGAHVNREPSTYETMIRAELSHGHTEQARAIFERMKARAFPVALINRARSLFDNA